MLIISKTIGEWSSAVEFQHNDKKYPSTGYTPFELNFGQHLWKRDITIKTELPKLETFLEELQRSWEDKTKKKI